MIEFRILLFLSVIALFSLILERKYRWARSFSASLICITLGIVCSNLEIIPHASPVYDGVFTYLVPIAVFFILLHVDIRELKKAGPKMLSAFALGAITVIVGVTVGIVLFKTFMGEDYWKIAGIFTGTYIGGGVNYIGVASALEVPPNILAGGAAADNITTAIWMVVCILTPKFFLKTEHMNAALAKKFETRQEMLEMSLESFAALVGLALFAFFISSKLHQWIPAVPSILWVTTISLLLAQCKQVKEYRGSEILGSYSILLFFVTLGAICNVREMMHIGVYLFFFTLVIVFIHGFLLVVLGRFFKLPPAVLVLCSQACIGGAPSAVSLAKVLGLKKYLASTAIIGVLGYAVGNYLGVMIAYLFKAIM